ncbi:putative membrane protein [Streptomyces himastatinicus ATCC 53653]|uniref:Putative membrane protein n=1 Tax=Streptomyces himastatinicus ATCC 53653 TaxID=457427 RepID=D9W7Y5_9ACTN|nr:SpoIIE family protein phosphatase [Streptomyces himastatinicus]EFL20519.1 putative membrane protein [Streptomyces himastatinicus ATCC 53653]
MGKWHGVRWLSNFRTAIAFALVGPLIVSLLLVPFRTAFPRTDSSLVLVAVVVAVAALGYRSAGVVAALSATIWFDFFLTRPWGALSVTSAQEAWTAALLLAIGLAVSELAVRALSQRDRARSAHDRLKLLHDASTAIGATLDAERTAQELAQVAVGRFADFVTVDLAVCVLAGEEMPSEGVTHVRRVAVAGVRRDHPLLPVGGPPRLALCDPVARGSPCGRARIEPDLRACVDWQALVPEPAGAVLDHGMRSLITAPLRARGSVLGMVAFWRTQDTRPFTDSDLSDAGELAAKAVAAIDNARRYTRERATALALQRNLLPRHLPQQTAVDVASRYLPADSRAGVGGDWFDVIPLSGSRVALVVGDVVGHGINASATMGRLRTAVRTLADVDLPPDELLTYLDDLVIHLTDDERDTPEEDTDTTGGVGATCLYAVYDPVARHCALASAGHPLPVLVTPGGRADLMCGFTGPPLGVGGLPFETTELDLAEGSTLALYSDGLVRASDRDIDAGLTKLCDALSVPDASLNTACDTVLRTLAADRPADDITLLLARTRALTPDRVAGWDIADDPALVIQARKLAVEQLDAWGLWDLTFITELLVSELVTNAIRYGAVPIHLRLIRDRKLIIEVSDASSTTPHLRRTLAYDEGGRGLVLVAQLSHNWGTRQTTAGKTIWCEQKLPVTE